MIFVWMDKKLELGTPQNLEKYSGKSRKCSHNLTLKHMWSVRGCSTKRFDQKWSHIPNLTRTFGIYQHLSAGFYNPMWATELELSHVWHITLSGWDNAIYLQTLKGKPSTKIKDSVTIGVGGASLDSVTVSLFVCLSKLQWDEQDCLGQPQSQI